MIPAMATVVIVDDNERFRRSARGLLELDGYEVIGEAADAAGALELVPRLRPDVVLLDIALPDGSGLDVAERLAPAPSRIVLVSSRDSSDFGARVERSGATGFISKDELSGATLAALLAGAS
jgi:two-component system, NarL family, nitrate/nitrite response regulator NarL